jgi:rSAM/selenodomain-associated transferase 1
MRQNHLVIMAKQPAAGRVKTRLARQVGGAEALRVYRTVLGRTLRMLSGDPRWRTWIGVAPDVAVGDRVWPGDAHQIAQGNGDLGARMQRMFDVLPPGPVVIIGSDVPGIVRRDIAAAFARLGGHDAVFGPAPDGGYWLVGARRVPHVLKMFAGVRWSSEHALVDTVANLNGKRVAKLREIADLDEAGEYLRWRKG